MSTPTTNTVATQGLTRVVHSLDRQVTPPVPLGKPELNEVLALAETMRALAGDGIAPILDRAWEASNALDQADAILAGTPIGDDLLTLDPEELTRQAVERAHNRAANLTIGASATIYYRDEVARLLLIELKDSADEAVKAMRREFNRHAKVVQAAHAAGITADTDRTALLETGTQQQIEAFRTIGPAVAGLDQIAGLRIQMGRTLRYGLLDPEVAMFITGVKNGLDLEGAELRYDDPTEVVQYDQAFTGSTFINVRNDRLGGAWLALLNGGHKLHLNTADEMQAVLGTARKAA